jgi:hypothetical protein
MTNMSRNRAVVTWKKKKKASLVGATLCGVDDIAVQVQDSTIFVQAPNRINKQI